MLLFYVIKELICLQLRIFSATFNFSSEYSSVVETLLEQYCYLVLLIACSGMISSRLRHAGELDWSTVPF
jgi:hypothetical protein